MSAIQTIRRRLDLTQAALAEAIGVTQGNVSFYERGQTVPPGVAAKLIEFAGSKGLPIGFDHIYGAKELPPELIGQPGAPAIPEPAKVA